MKNKIVLASVFAALGGLAALANPARAGTDLRITANFGARPGAPVVAPGYGYGYAAPVYNAPVYGAPSAPAYGYSERATAAPECRPPIAPRGYWKEIVVKTWMPARWVTRCDFRGREVRTWEGGYFTYVTDRVWVDLGRDHDHRLHG